MDSESLDRCIQTALSSLYPPFHATSSTVLCQVFNVVESCYRGDGLRYLIHFLLPAKQFLQNLQQDACLQYCGLLFRHEGWPLCIHEKVVVHLCPLDQRLLCPGDFYLLVSSPPPPPTPRAHSASCRSGVPSSPRLLVCSLSAGSRHVEQQEVSELALRSLFRMAWLDSVNREREQRGASRMERCLLSAHGDVFRVPWEDLVYPQFINQPRTSLKKDKESPVKDRDMFINTSQDPCRDTPEQDVKLLSSSTKNNQSAASGEDSEGEYVELTELPLPRFSPQKGSLTQFISLQHRARRSTYTLSAAPHTPNNTHTLSDATHTPNNTHTHSAATHTPNNTHTLSAATHTPNNTHKLSAVTHTHLTCSARTPLSWSRVEVSSQTSLCSRLIEENLNQDSCGPVILTPVSPITSSSSASAPAEVVETSSCQSEHRLSQEQMEGTDSAKSLNLCTEPENCTKLRELEGEEEELVREDGELREDRKSEMTVSADESGEKEDDEMQEEREEQLEKVECKMDESLLLDTDTAAEGEEMDEEHEDESEETEDDGDEEGELEEERAEEVEVEEEVQLIIVQQSQERAEEQHSMDGGEKSVLRGEEAKEEQEKGGRQMDKEAESCTNTQSEDNTQHTHCEDSCSEVNTLQAHSMESEESMSQNTEIEESQTEHTHWDDSVKQHTHSENSYSERNTQHTHSENSDSEKNTLPARSEESEGFQRKTCSEVNTLQAHSMESEESMSQNTEIEESQTEHTHWDDSVKQHTCSENPYSERNTQHTHSEDSYSEKNTLNTLQNTLQTHSEISPLEKNTHSEESHVENNLQQAQSDSYCSENALQTHSGDSYSEKTLQTHSESSYSESTLQTKSEDSYSASKMVQTHPDNSYSEKTLQTHTEDSYSENKIVQPHLGCSSSESTLQTHSEESEVSSTQHSQSEDSYSENCTQHTNPEESNTSLSVSTPALDPGPCRNELQESESRPKKEEEEEECGCEEVGGGRTAELQSEGSSGETPPVQSDISFFIGPSPPTEPEQPADQSVPVQLPRSSRPSQSSFNSVLLRSAALCLPGTRDRNGRALLTVCTSNAVWSNPDCDSAELLRLLLYYTSTLRKDVRALGLTVLVDARRAAPVPALFAALRSLQDNKAESIHTVLLLVNKDSSLRLDKPAAVQVEVLSSLKSVQKHVEVRQLPTEFGGSFSFNQSSWLCFRSRVEQLTNQCEDVIHLLQKTINILQSTPLPAAAEEAELLLARYQAVMRSILEDSRLVQLQQEGGASLSRLRREESSISMTEDYRAAMEMVSSLDKQVDELLHHLVTLANARTQELQFIGEFSSLEKGFNEVTSWLEVGEVRLKSLDESVDSLELLHKKQQDFKDFYTTAYDQCKRGEALLARLERWDDMSTADLRQYEVKVHSFWAQLQDFSQRVNTTGHNIDQTVRLYSFLDQAYGWALKGMRHLAGISMEECTLPDKCQAVIGCLEDYHRQHPPIPDTRFQEMKAVAGELRGERGLRQWSFAWSKCQETKKMFDRKMEAALRTRDSAHRRRSDSTQSRSSTSLTRKTLSGLWGGRETSSSPTEDSVTSSPLPTLPLHTSSPLPQQNTTSSPEPKQNTTSSPEPQQNTTSSPSPPQITTPSPIPPQNCTPSPSPPQNITSFTTPPQNTTSSPIPPQNRTSSPIPPQNITSSPSAPQHTPLLQRLFRSVSSEEASDRFDLCSSSPSLPRLNSSTSLIPSSPCSSSSSFSNRRQQLRKTQSFDCPSTPETTRYGPCPRALNEPVRRGNTGVFIRGLEVSSSEAADHTLCPRTAAHSWAGQGLRSPGTPGTPRTTGSPVTDPRPRGSKLRHIVEEMVTTEREYVRSLRYIIHHYFPEMDRADLPQDLRGKRSVVFGNLEKLLDFHSQFFLRELEACWKHPLRVPHCFLRHQEQFSLYALYSKNKPKSDSLLANHGNSFFRRKQVELGDKMDLSSYLLKPVQRMSKYALLLTDLMKEVGVAQEAEFVALQSATNMVKFQLRHGNDLLAMDAIRDCDVNLKEQGQLIRQDEFTVWTGRRKCQRHVFLFEELVLFSKPKKMDGGLDVFIYKHSFKTADVGLTESTGNDGLRFEIWFRRRTTKNQTFILQATATDIKHAWTSDIARILWNQANRNKEMRLKEMVSMGVGNKPFLDIQPSDAAISDRAVHYIMKSRGARTRASIAVSVFDHSNPFKRGTVTPDPSSGPSSCSLLGPLNLHMYSQTLPSSSSSSAAESSFITSCIEEDEQEHETGSQPSMTTESSGSSSRCLSGSTGSDSGCVSSHLQEALPEEPSPPGQPSCSSSSSSSSSNKQHLTSEYISPKSAPVVSPATVV